FGTVFRLGFVPTSQLSVSGTGVYGGPISLSATLTVRGSALAGRRGTFTVNGLSFAAITDSFGVATLPALTPGFFNARTYSHAVSATFAGDDASGASSAVGDLVIAKATPFISWRSPAPIRLRTALDGTQLNAITNVSGTLTYDPPPGTLLPVG